MATTDTSRHSCTGWASTTRILQQNDMVLRRWHLLSLTPRWITVQNLNTPLQVVQRLVGCGRAWVTACICQSRFLQPHKALFGSCNPCLPNGLLFQVLYALLNHPKRAIHPLHFVVTRAIFCTPLLRPPPPQSSQSTNLHTPLFPRLKPFSTKLHSTQVQSLLHSYIDNTVAQYTLHVLCH